MPDAVTASPQTSSSPPPAGQDARERFHRTRWVAIVAGLLGFVLALATPLLPVVQTTASVNWPQNGVIGDVEAPLMAQVPIDVNASIPCTAVSSLPEGGGILLSTAPAQGDGA
ncbi:arabinosyltransferase, partial [Rhodococcus enclensis]|nr:arabinosyltransferase [Rhodococcus qingshengii]